jgi:hypothetical protein
MATVLNIVLMQLNWFACVLGAAHGLPWVGVASSLALATWHLARAGDVRVEARLMAAALVLGLLIDSALAAGGFVVFVSGVVLPSLTTPWMLGLWLGFATTLNASLSWLLARPTLAILFGIVGAPVAYWCGARLGAIELGPAIQSLIAIGIAWGVAMAVFALLARSQRRDTRAGAIA